MTHLNLSLVFVSLAIVLPTLSQAFLHTQDPELKKSLVGACGRIKSGKDAKGAFDCFQTPKVFTDQLKQCMEKNGVKEPPEEKIMMKFNHACERLKNDDGKGEKGPKAPPNGGKGHPKCEFTPEAMDAMKQHRKDVEGAKKASIIACIDKVAKA